MATLIDVDRVKYTCSCNRVKPLCYLYFCKHCVTLKCKECVMHEIDPKYYCPYCFDNKTSKEASQFKYKCTNCYNCPCCKHTLMVRGTSLSNKAVADTQQDKSITTKVFYLVCGFCRWTTRDVGIADATQMPGGWKLQENLHSKRIFELVESYKGIAAREKLEKERKKYPYGKRKAYQAVVANDIYGILTPFQKMLSQQSDDVVSKDGQGKPRLLALEPSIALETFDETAVIDEYTKDGFSVDLITSIEQRLSNPEFQTNFCSKLYPLNKFFITKESKRCNICEHNVIKPENNITSIKFKLHQMALFLVPEIRIISIPQWKLNENNQVILSLTNKCESEVNVTLFSSVEASNKNYSAKIVFPTENEQITLDRQDTKSPNAVFKQIDNLDYICYRKDNKVAIYCNVIPLKEDGEIECKFTMKHSYYGMSADLQAAPIMQNLSQEVTINFGSFKSPLLTIRPKYIDECVSSSSLTK